MNQQTNLRRVAWIVVILAVALIAIMLVTLLKGVAELTIISEEGAEIAITNERHSEFKSIGITTASYKASELPETIYIQVTKDGKKTLSSIVLTEKKSYKRELSLHDTINAKKVTEGALSNIYLEEPIVQGIMPSESRIINFKTDEFTPPRNDFIGFPQLKKIVWQDKDNFIYNSYQAGIGRFTNGSILGGIGLASKVIYPDGSEGKLNLYDKDSGPGFFFTDISKTSGKPFTLLAPNSLYTSSDLGRTVNRITTFDEVDSSVHMIFTDSSYIYRFTGQPPASYADETDNLGSVATESTQPSGWITKYDYNGKVITEIEISHFENALSITGKDPYILALNHDTLVVTSDKDTWRFPLYFSYPRNLVEYKDNVLLLADDSLWRITDGGQSIQQLFHFSQNGVGVQDSLVVTDNGRVIFSTERTVDNPDTTDAIFSISL